MDTKQPTDDPDEMVWSETYGAMIPARDAQPRPVSIWPEARSTMRGIGFVLAMLIGLAAIGLLLWAVGWLVGAQ